MPIIKTNLFNLGMVRIAEFLKTNKLPDLEVYDVEKSEWFVGACAYYRPKEIKICQAECARPASENQVRNWNWPGSTTDRTVYGVLAHELGHHVDYMSGFQRGKYYSDYSGNLRKETKEQPITSYAPNDAEWFAEIMRLFITNPQLLQAIRPKTYEAIARDFIPPETKSKLWVDDLLLYNGSKPPARIVRALSNKIRNQ